MKKSKIVKLVLITATLASCHRSHPNRNSDWAGNQTYMRSDESADYSYNGGGANALLWYYAFHPYGMYYGGGYHVGYYSTSISHYSNVGTSSAKSNVSRGGFGSSGSRTVSS